MVKHIHVTYHLNLDMDLLEKAERTHRIHAEFCPVARTIWDCVEITTSLNTYPLEA